MINRGIKNAFAQNPTKLSSFTQINTDYNPTMLPPKEFFIVTNEGSPIIDTNGNYLKTN